MKLILKSVERPGDYLHERAVLQATEELDLNYYAVFACFADVDGSLFSGPVEAYWFSGKKIVSGDLVVLYTKKGPRAEKKSATGRTSHFFYWNKESPLWTGIKKPVVVYTQTWERPNVDDATVEPVPDAPEV